MKKIFLLTLVCFNIINLTAQINYYEDTKTFYEDGYTYQCDVPIWKSLTLYNIKNKLTYANVRYKAKGDIFDPISGARLDLFEDDEWTKPLCYSIVNNAFSDTEKARVKGHELLTTMYINSETGKVMEVNFMFTTFSPYATIPVSVYRKIETEIKSKVWFTPTEKGKKLNYIMRFWGQEPEITTSSQPTEPQ